MATESTENWKFWYKKMTPEERRQYNKDKYLTYKDKASLASIKWKENNSFRHNLYQCSYHSKKKYPIAFTPESPDKDALLAWANEQPKECIYCGREATSLDHKHPLSRGGTHTFDNLQLICADCNYAKRARTDEEFRAWLLDLIGHSFELSAKVVV